MLPGRECAVPDLGGVRLDSVAYDVVEVRVLLDELGLEGLVHAQHVLNHQNLPVAVRPCTDADGWNIQCFGHLFGDRSGDALEDQGKDPCVLKSQSVFLEQKGGLFAPGLHPRKR